MTTMSQTRPTPARPAPPGASRPGGRTPSAAATIDPLRVLRRHLVVIIAAAAVGLAMGVVGFIVLAKVYPLYSGHVFFEIRPPLQNAGDIGAADLMDDETVYRMGQTETTLLVHRATLETAINDPTIRTTKWHQKFVRNGVFDQNRAIDELLDDIRATMMRNSNLFTVSWSAHEPLDVPKVLNALADAYMRSREARDTVIYDKNKGAFVQQLSSTQRELENVAQAMNDLLRRGNITSLNDIRHSAHGVRMEQLTQQHAAAAGNFNVAQTQLAHVNEQLRGTIEPNMLDIYEAERDQSVASMIENLQFYKAEHRRLVAHVKADNPQLRQLEQRIAAMEQERDAKVKELVRRNLEARARSLTVEVDKFRNALEEFERELEKTRLVLTDMAAEQSQYEALETRREHLEAQRVADMQLVNEVELMRLRADAARVRTAQRAITPREPSFPKPHIIIPLSLLAFVGLTIGIVFLRELLDQRVKSASDLAVLPGAIVLGGIPDAQDDPTGINAAELVVRNQPFSVLAESYRQVATTLLPRLDRSGHQTLVLVGGLPDSGTTTVATNLAAAAAASGRKVLVVDANFRRPRLAEAMGLDRDAPGLGDLLSSAATLEQATMAAGEGIQVIPAGTPANRVFDRLNNGAFDSLLAELRGRFDLIIFDAPPAVIAGDAMVLANRVDAAVLVVRAHQEHRGLVARMINRLGDARSELLGVLLNRQRGVAGGYLRKNYAAMAQYTANSSG